LGVRIAAKLPVGVEGVALAETVVEVIARRTGEEVALAIMTRLHYVFSS
jgi:hypothetical protein